MAGSTNILAVVCGAFVVITLITSIFTTQSSQPVAEEVNTIFAKTIGYKMQEKKIYSGSVTQSNSMTNFAKPSRRLIESYQRQAEERKTFMDTVDNMPNDMEGYARIYNNLAPEVWCAEKIKVGTTDDGGKWMCSPYNLPDNCTILSFGLNNAVSFEAAIQKMTNKRCRIFGFDSAEQSEDTKDIFRNIGAVSMKAFISNSTDEENDKYTIERLMEIKGINKIEILKFDIEGAELYTMEEFLDNNIVSQILIEVHGTPKETLSFLRMVASKGYYMFHYEINGAWHNLAEYAFIHKEKLNQYEGTLLAKYL